MLIKIADTHIQYIRMSRVKCSIFCDAPFPNPAHPSSYFITSPQRPGSTGNIFLQLAHNIVALQVEKRCYTYYHPAQTLSRNKISLLQVEVACCTELNWRLLFSTNACNNIFCCVTMFEVGGNTANNAFQLETILQVAAICCSHYFTLKCI